MDRFRIAGSAALSAQLFESALKHRNKRAGLELLGDGGDVGEAIGLRAAAQFG